ncbi:hypothetical protein ACMFMG_006069 [Clarireedia jacksonii]
MPKRQGVFELVPETLAKPTAPSRMTSKQAKRAWQKAQRAPRITKEEQRRRDAEELKRHREEHKKYLKEREKEKAAAKAKAAREKKAAKELAEKEERRKKGLPESSKYVRPSQPRISMFVKGIKRGRGTDSMAEDSEGTMCDDPEEMQPPAKRVALDDSEDEFGDFPTFSDNDITLLENNSIRYTPSNCEHADRAGSVAFSRPISRNATPMNDELELPRLNHIERDGQSPESVQVLEDEVDSQLHSEAAEAANRSQEEAVRSAKEQNKDCNSAATDSASALLPTYALSEHKDYNPLVTRYGARTMDTPLKSGTSILLKPHRVGQAESSEAQSTSQAQANQHNQKAHTSSSSGISFARKQPIDPPAEASNTSREVKPTTAELAKAPSKFDVRPKFDRISNKNHESMRRPLQEQPLNSPPIATSRSSGARILNANPPLSSSNRKNNTTRPSAFRTPQNNATVNRPSRPETPRSMGPQSLPPKSKPSVPLPAPLRTKPPQTRPQYYPSRNNSNLPPSSTQAFIESHIDFFPSPTQEAREISEDFSPPPRLSHAQKTQPTPVAVTYGKNSFIEDEFSMISTQDLMSSQEMREIATPFLPAKMKDNNTNDEKVAEENNDGKDEDREKSHGASFMDFTDLICSQDSFFSSQELDNSLPAPVSVPALAPSSTRCPAQTTNLLPAKPPSPPPPPSKHSNPPNSNRPSQSNFHSPHKQTSSPRNKTAPNPPQQRRKPYFQEKPEDRPPATIIPLTHTPTTTSITSSVTTTTRRKARFFIEKEEDIFAAALAESELFAVVESTPRERGDSGWGRREGDMGGGRGDGRVDGSVRGNEVVREKEERGNGGEKRTLERVISGASTDYGDLELDIDFEGKWRWE